LQNNKLKYSNELFIFKGILYQSKTATIALPWIICAVPMIYFIYEAKQEKVTTDCEYRDILSVRVLLCVGVAVAWGFQR
jgi:hypothetical protein